MTALKCEIFKVYLLHPFFRLWQKCQVRCRAKFLTCCCFSVILLLRIKKKRLLIRFLMCVV